MKYRKLVLGLIAVSIASTMAFPVHAEDTRISIDGGNGSWHGGIDESENIVYSKIWDHVVDGHAYQATVWVKNALGKGEEYPGKTYGINDAGEIKVTCKAVYVPLVKNKAGYRDLVVVDAYSRQKYLMDRPHHLPLKRNLSLQIPLQKNKQLELQREAKKQSPPFVHDGVKTYETSFPNYWCYVQYSADILLFAIFQLCYFPNEYWNVFRLQR